MATHMDDDVEFWRMSTVKAKTGLCRSEIYRQIKTGGFPKSRPYPHCRQSRFWLSTEVRAWQASVLTDQFSDLLG